MNQSEFNKKFIECITRSQNENELMPLVKDSARLSAARAFEVYREDYQVRMTEALKNTFRSIHSVLGDDDFFRMALDYLDRYPSSFSDLDEYGHHLPHYLKNHSLSEDYPFLSQLADFEWAFREIFHSGEVLGPNADELQKLFADENTKLVLSPSAKVLHYDFSIEKIYSHKDSDEEKMNYSSEQFILLFKKNSLVKLHLLSKNQWELVKFFHTPKSLLECVQNAPATMTPEEMSGLFRVLATEQILLKSF